ncbi:MAG TPA: FISUMP domain-containing protein [Melioribacteraceae bacterium]|nr:FISUMP domain-containing protein [Melioribacteraceae bacterium]
MKTFNSTLLVIIFIIAAQINFAQYTPDSTVTDYDGNVYRTVKIGNQIWMAENLRSTHYADGTLIPDVVSYNNSDSLEAIYGKLYTWHAAMKNSTSQKTQGASPNGWHIPSDAEWKELENYLGGAAIAGGKMKDTGTQHWKAPNTGATNSSGLSILPGGEYDAYYTPHVFRIINEYAVFWTSTQVGNLKARERFLTHNSAASEIYDWFKVMKYSIRCIKDEITDVEDEIIKPQGFKLNQNYPNPFNPTTNIEYSINNDLHVKLSVYNVLGELLFNVVNSFKTKGNYSEIIDMSNYNSGVYYYSLNAGNITETKKMIYLK